MALDKIVEWNKARNNVAFNAQSEFDMLQEELDELEEACIYGTYHDSEGTVIQLTPEEIEHETIDALADLIVVACGAIHKKGYNPNLVMLEVVQEISSRQQDPLQAISWRMEGPDGKWKKDANQDPSTLYKANYSNCLYSELDEFKAELNELRKDLLNG